MPTQLTSLRSPDEKVIHHADAVDHVRSLARTYHAAVTVLLEQTFTRSERGLNETVTITRKCDELYEETTREEYDVLYRERMTVRLRTWALFAEGEESAARRFAWRLSCTHSTHLRRIVRTHMRRRRLKKAELTRGQEGVLFGEGKGWVYGRNCGERMEVRGLRVEVGLSSSNLAQVKGKLGIPTFD